MLTFVYAAIAAFIIVVIVLVIALAFAQRMPARRLPVAGVMHTVGRDGRTSCGFSIAGHSSGIAPFIDCEVCE